MTISMRTIRGAAAGTVGAAAVAGAMLFGGTPAANAAPAPTPGTSFAEFGPHGPGIAPTWGGHGFGGGHGGFGGGHGGFGARRLGPRRLWARRRRLGPRRLGPRRLWPRLGRLGSPRLVPVVLSH